MKNRIVYIDMDDTIADFLGSDQLPNRGEDVTPMYELGFFRDLKPVAGALAGVRAIIRMGYDVQILTQPLAESAHCYSEKVQWIALWFPELVGKINMMQDKGQALGHYLVDDNALKWKEKFEKNGGTFVHFRHTEDHKKEWDRIVEFFRVEAMNNERR